jgi:iron transport multicopper oxidase
VLCPFFSRFIFRFDFAEDFAIAATILPLFSLATMWLAFAFLLALGPTFLHCAYTDEIQDADPAQSGYLSNHNLDPAVVKSSSFGILWKNTYGAKERWYAKPLVYTPPGASQLVFTASAMNVVRALDAVNGTLLKSRTVQPPFLMSDIGCGDIPDYIGIIVSLALHESNYVLTHRNILGNANHRS